MRKVVNFLMVIVILFVFPLGCMHIVDKQYNKHSVKPSYEAGEIVKVKLTGENAQILDSTCSLRQCEYRVRVKNYESQWLREFELEKILKGNPKRTK